MTPIAPHITSFLQQRLPLERQASHNTCESYAYAFQLLFEYARDCLKVAPSDLQLEQLDAPPVLNFLSHLEKVRGNVPSSRNIRLAAIKAFMRFMEYRVPSALEQIRRILAIPTKKSESRLVKHLTAEEASRRKEARRRMCLARRAMPQKRGKVTSVGFSSRPRWCGWKDGSRRTMRASS